MAHARRDVGSAIAGTAGARPVAISGRRLKIIVIIGIFSILFALVASLHHGFEIGDLIVKPASGDSMLPWSRDGDTLVVWTNFSLVPGKKYLFRVSKDLQCKKLSKVGSDTLHLESLNREGSSGAYFEVKRSDVVGQVKCVIPTHLIWHNDDSHQPAPTKMRRITPEQKVASYRNALKAERKARKLFAEQRTRAIPCSNSSSACDSDLKTFVLLSRGETLVIKPQARFRRLALWAQSDDNIWVNGHDTGPYSGSWCHKVLDTKGDKVTIEVRQASGKMAPPGAMINEIVFLP